MRIDNHTDPFATIVSVKFGDKLGDLLDTVSSKQIGRRRVCAPCLPWSFLLRYGYWDLNLPIGVGSAIFVFHTCPLRGSVDCLGPPDASLLQ